MPNECNSFNADPICTDEAYPRYLPGEWEVICVKVETYPDPRFRARGKDGILRATWKCRLDCFRVSDNAPISGFLNMGNEAKPQAGRGSRYWKTWVMASGTQPRKRQTMSRRVFVGKVFRVRVGDISKDYEGRAQPDGAVYSTIKDFLARTGP